MSERRGEWWEDDAQPNFTIGSYIPGSDHAPIPDEDMPVRRPIGFITEFPRLERKSKKARRKK